MTISPVLTIIGGGLAGCEAAWQAAIRGIDVKLYEMRPVKMTGVHQTDKLSEIICSNSLGTRTPTRPSGSLMVELDLLNSLLLECAKETALPAGTALAVDRDAFSNLVTEKLTSQSRITVIRGEMKTIPSSPTIISSGPLTSPDLSKAIVGLTGEEALFFFDAISPIVKAESINMEIAFRASRFGKDMDIAGDYINCPMNADEYHCFVDTLVNAERIPMESFDQPVLSGVKAGSQQYFEGCLPVEVMAARGRDSLAFGPMRPIGLRDPRTGKRPYAVLQLRQDNLAGNLFNMVGFQTNLRYPEQQRVFRMVPGLENAEFIRFGQMHRNTFIASPLLLLPSLQFKHRPDLFFTGQITGVEGYLSNIATGLVAGINAARYFQTQEQLIFPAETMIGALLHYITHAEMKDFQPMKANFGILPPLPARLKSRQDRSSAYAERCLETMQKFIQSINNECTT